MNRTAQFVFLSLLGFLPSTLVAQEVTSFLNEDRQIVIQATGIGGLLGLDFQSSSGSLIPVPDGSSDPFDILIVNEPVQVSFGELGAPGVIVDGELTLNVGYNEPASGFDLVGRWGTFEGEGLITFEASDIVDGGDGGMTDGGMTDGGMTDGGMTDGGDGGMTDGGMMDGGGTGNTGGQNPMIPEPGSLPLMMAGAAFLLASRRAGPRVRK